MNSNQLFIALTETWLRDHLDAELKIQGYTCFRSDRVRPRRHQRGRDSGGVAIYIRDDLASTAENILTYSNSVVEVLCVYIKAENIFVTVVYRQPDDTKGGHRSTSREFQHALNEIKRSLNSLPSPTPDIVMCGDFNLPHVKWPEGTAGKKASKEEKLMSKALEELLTEHFLMQVVQTPTHRSGNTLDLCFSNNAALVHSYNCCPSIFSDHHILEFRTTFNQNTTQEKSFRQIRNPEELGARFDNLNFLSEEADWEGLERELNQQAWDEILSSNDETEMLSNFVNVCVETSQTYMPKRKSNEKRNFSQVPRKRRILMRRRGKINKQLASHATDEKRTRLTSELVDIEKKLQMSYKSEKSEMEHKAVSAIKRNSKYFFSYARKFSKIFTGIGPLISALDEIVSCPVQMAEMLANQYQKVFSTPKEVLPDAQEIFGNQELPRCLSDIEFHEEDIIKAIDEISPTASAGPDRFPAILLKQCKNALAKPLYIIWRKSLDSGSIPSILKSAHVIPVYKGGCRGAPKNYRPIALTSHLIKIFEKVLRAKLVEFMEKHCLFNPSQHGFRFGRSCLSQLLSHYDHILELLETGGNVDVIYIDFAKAFDKVDFGITLKKIHALGISGRVGKWIYSFLTNRTQTILVNSSRSQPCQVKSGVPQGSVLGPLLFLILIGDIDRNIAKSFLSSFADDTRIGCHITSLEDTQALQQDLQAVYTWTSENNMELHGDKFECLRYGPNEEIRTSAQYTSNTGAIISEKEHVRDLGVAMDRKGDFTGHIANIVAEAKKQCSWIFRTFNTREITPMLTLWKSLVQSKLEYCSQLWCPLKTGDIQALEMTQRSFIRKLSGMNQLTYWQQLKLLKLYSLERRRECYRIIYVWRVLEGQVPNIGSRRISAKWHMRRGRECIPPKISRNAHSQVQRLIYASLPVHGQQLFNALPTEVRNLTGCTVDAFKSKLDRFLQTVPDEPQIQGYTAMRRAGSNSLLDMIKFSTANIPGDRASDSNGVVYDIALGED